jgi:predicted ATPase
LLNDLRRKTIAAVADFLHPLDYRAAEGDASRERRDNAVDAAVSTVDDALALAEETGERFTDSFLHRLRGTILLKRDPANPAPAEEAFLTALAVAKQQGARSFELRAALSLAKLYQSTRRPAEAHAVLAPALDGFSPTLEMPEIAEAQALLGEFANAPPDEKL